MSNANEEFRGLTESQYRQVILDPRPPTRKMGMANITAANHPVPVMQLDPADAVRLEKFKFIDKEFPLRTLTVYEPPQEKIRVGRDLDGGYVIVGGMSYDVLLSCGINDDDSFEHAFVSLYDAPVFAFDGTIDSFPNEHEEISFIKKNISDTNSDTEDNLKELISAHKDIFLKMDIEGDEYLWLNSLTEDELEKLKQITIEFHEPYEKYKWRCLERLSKSHWAFHFNPNNCGAVCFHGHTKVPESFEMTYVRKSEIKGTPSMNTAPFPTKMDKPNDPQRPIIVYEGEPFCQEDFRSYLT